MIEVKNLIKRYDREVLKGITYRFQENKIYVIKGVSGCGKTTLLNILGGLDSEYEGEYFFKGQQVNESKNKKRAKLRREFGYIFQRSLLISHMTVLENLLYISNSEEIIRRYAKELDVEELLDRYPDQLSGGQRQRISIIRSLIVNPSVILADEPTASLDKRNSKEVANTFSRLKKEGRIIIISTHESYFDDIADEIIYLDYGKVGDVIHNQIAAKEDVMSNVDISQSNNSLKVLLPFIFRRNKEKYRISALLPITVIITMLLICFAVQGNFKKECIRYSMEQYPMEVISVYRNLYDYNIKSVCSDAKRYDLYIVQEEEYVCYPLLEDGDSVLSYGNLIKYGSFPKSEKEVLVSYKLAEELVGNENVADCLGDNISVSDKEYTVSGVVADMENDENIDVSIYMADLYYGEIENEHIVYVPYAEISTYGTLIDTDDCLVKIPNLYNDDKLYNYIKEDVMVGALSVWDEKISGIQFMIDMVSKIIVCAFAAVAVLATIFIKNDIDMDLFYRKRELGYLQIFGVSKRVIKLQIILEKTIKNVLSLCIAFGLYYVAAIAVKYIFDINGFVSATQVILILAIVLGFSLVSVLIPIRKYMKKSVLKLITE